LRATIDMRAASLSVNQALFTDGLIVEIPNLSTTYGRDADGPEEERPALLRTLGMRVCETHSHRTHAGGLQRAAQCAR